MRSFCAGRSDKKTYLKLEWIMKTLGDGFSKKIQNFTAVLKKAEKENSILTKLIFQPGTGRDAMKVSRDEPRVLFNATQPVD